MRTVSPRYPQPSAGTEGLRGVRMGSMCAGLWVSRAFRELFGQCSVLSAGGLAPVQWRRPPRGHILTRHASLLIIEPLLPHRAGS